MAYRKIILKDLWHKHPADIAEALTNVSEEQAAELIHRLFLREAAAETLEEMEPDESAELISDLDREEVIAILARMDPDDAVDLLEELPLDIQQEILDQIDTKEAQVLSNLLQYPPDTAGGLMSPEVAALHSGMSAEEALGILRQQIEELETIYYAYVINANRHLQGVLSLRDLALASPGTSIDTLVNKDTVSVSVDTDVEEVAHLFDKYNYVALPVIDEKNELLGVITVDDVIDVIREEATEDIYGMASVPREENINTGLFASMWMRLPWLYIRLATAIIAALVVGMFEETIAKVAALAVLMGVIAGQGGSTGMQTVTIITRAIALGELEPGTGWRLLRKEVLLGCINGLLIGITIGTVTYLWKGDYMLGVVACCAMILNVVVAGAVGVVAPLTMHALGRDPAVMSGILLTTMTDVFGFALLFALAVLLLPGI